MGPGTHGNLKLIKIHKFIKMTLNVCLIALNRWNGTNKYLQKWRKQSPKDVILFGHVGHFPSIGCTDY